MLDLILFIIFIYCLVGMRILIFFCNLIRTVLMHSDDVFEESNQLLELDKDKLIDKNLQAAYIRKFFYRSITAVLLWPIDMILIPKDFIGALVLSDKAHIFNLCHYYGRTK